MKLYNNFCIFIAIAILPGISEAGQDRLENLRMPYQQIKTLSCEIRRDITLPEGETLRMLSRVYYERDDRMHAETFSPVRRRMVCNGKILRMFIEGANKGFESPVIKLDQEMLVNLRSVPGSPENYLMVIENAREVPLEPLDNSSQERSGFDNGKSFTVVSTDNIGRVVRIEVFESPEMTKLILQTDFSAFQEILPGVWLPCLHRTRKIIMGVEQNETMRVDRPVANKTIPASLFDSDAFFKGVEFVESLDKLGF